MRITFALLTACLACAFAASAASAKQLDGPTSIRDIEVVRPTTGSERGSLVVWVRARHGGVTASGRRNAVGGATSHGVVRVRIAGVGERTTMRELDFAGGERGYTVRFPNAKAAGTVDVRVAATQWLDLDGDGESEAKSSDSASEQGVTPSPVAQTIAPPSGTYGLGGFPNGNGFAVQGGEVKVFWVSSDTGCESDVVPSAPINPVTGAFAFDVKGVKASGTFAAGGNAIVNASWQGALGAGGPKCEGSLPTDSAYRFVSP